MGSEVDDIILSIPAHLEGAARKISVTIADALSIVGNACLKMRVGRMTGDGFERDVGRARFVAALGALESFERWSVAGKWVESHVVTYKAMIPGRSVYTPDTVTTTVEPVDGGVAVEHSIRTTIEEIDFKSKRLDGYSCSMKEAESHDLDVNYTLETSVAVNNSALPHAVVTELVTIRQRKTFLLAAQGVAGDTFAYHLTIEYSGATRSEAEKNQAAGAGAKFTIEVECLGWQSYLAAVNNNHMMLSLSLLMKSFDVVNITSLEFKPDRTLV